MAANRFYSYAMTLLVGILGYLTFQILRPFMSPIAWAIVLSIVFYPVYALLLKYFRWKSIASLVTLCMVLLIIIGPFSYIFYLLLNEVKEVSGHIEAGTIESTIQDTLKHPRIRTIVDGLTNILNVSEADLNRSVIDSVKGFGKDFIGRISGSVGDFMTVIFNFIIMSFTVFFILKDGPGFLEKIRGYMPFSEDHKDRLARQIRDIIISTIYGGVAVAIIQGIIGGVSFYFLGISSPVLWGFAISIASFIPLLGAFAVWGPLAAYLLFVKGAMMQGLVLVLIGTFGISLIDNILKPIIIGSRTKMPVLAIFFSVLGGIKFFGLIGLIMGPLVLALFVSVIEIFRNIEGGQDA